MDDIGPLVERLIRIETKVDVALNQVTDHEGRTRALEQDNTPGGHQDHEARIRKLERSVWIAAGVCSGLGGVLGSVFGPILGK